MYRIQLPNFEGPFDLLLYFIKRDEIDIYDIPIAKITEEFLEYIRLMKLLDLELAGEFILMASTLMSIKAQLLLPQVKDEDDEIEDPRTELVQKLLEYKQIKEASEDLKDLEREHRNEYYRNYFPDDENQEIVYTNTTVFDLLTAFKFAIDRIDNAKKEHVVELIPVTVDEQKEELIRVVEIKGRIRFLDFVKNQSRDFVVVTFLAILDLIKNQELFIVQDDLFEDILISRKLNLN